MLTSSLLRLVSSLATNLPLLGTLAAINSCLIFTFYFCFLAYLPQPLAMHLLLSFGAFARICPSPLRGACLHLSPTLESWDTCNHTVDVTSFVPDPGGWSEDSVGVQVHPLAQCPARHEVSHLLAGRGGVACAASRPRFPKSICTRGVIEPSLVGTATPGLRRTKQFAPGHPGLDVARSGLAAKPPPAGPRAWDGGRPARCAPGAPRGRGNPTAQ